MFLDEEEENENSLNSVEEMEDSIMNIFGNIEESELLTKENEYYNKINSETKNIYYYLMNSINNFHNIFQNNSIKNFDDILMYLEQNAIPNKCVCAGVIETIPGWRCVDCSKYENAIYCSDCFKKSKHLHKDHTTYFLYSSGGMCDCGDPDSLYIFCPEHSGPFVNQKQIDEYISKNFNKEILDELTLFFDDFFVKFSKYLILTEKNELFYKEKFDEKFDGIIDEDNENENMDENENKKKLKNEKKDIILLKNNFCIVFQNLIHFLRLITQKNLAMLHLLANYLLKNNLENQKIEDDYYITNHRCINISENDINIINSDGQNHICNCPFLRLLISNWREEIKSKENENEEFLLSFPHNYPLRNAFCILYFFLNKQALLNNNADITYNRHQFFLEDTTELIGKKTFLIEETYEIFYENLKKMISSPKLREENGSFNQEKIKNIKIKTQFMENDTKYYSKPKMRKIMTEKRSIIKRIIDSFCLIHNLLEFKSIFPHPQFQDKQNCTDLIEVEIALSGIIEEINMYFEWEKIEIIKEIFKYIFDKIYNQEKEGIKQLKNDEYSYHLSLYRCLGLLINFFCFNYSFKNNCSLIDSIQFFKTKLFNSKEEIEKLEIIIDRILIDYFRFFGFLAGSKNNFFNYYEGLNNYPYIYYNDKRTLKIDFTLLKYLFALTEKRFDIDNYLKISNIENIYFSFDKIFRSKIYNDIRNDDNKMIIEEEEEKETNNIDHENIFNNLANNINNYINQTNNNNMPESGINNNVLFNKIMNTDENNYIMQWRYLFELIIIFMKDDSSPYWNLMRFYEETISSQTKRELFNIIRKNDNAMNDLKNILKEKIIHEIIAKDNLIDLRKLKKNIEKYLLILFEENDVNKIIDELTFNKMNGETKMFYLKDSCLKYLDMNYYITPKDKSKAQRYILDFKKDIIKLYNNYYFNPSKLTFDYFKITYEKILLNKNNLELIIKIIERLLINNKYDIDNFNIKSIKNSILPVILNYLSIFSMINTKSFIEFKIENRELINNIFNIFNYYLKNNKSDDILEKDLENNIKEVIKQLNNFDNIYNDIKFDLSKLNEYDYNTKYVEQLKKGVSNEKSMDGNNLDEIKLKKDKSKKIKDKLKLKMKNSSELFLTKVQSSKDIMDEINNENKNTENENESKDEIMCFYCRNPIKLDSLEIPYGKTGLLIKDFFYLNSKKSTVRIEINKMRKYNNIENNILIDDIINDCNNNIFDKNGRIISCGHYFHASCFKEGCDKNLVVKYFSCPICLKKQNILIPPLNNFIDKFIILKSENIKDLFDENKEIEEMNDEIKKEYLENKIFEIIFYFLKDIELFKPNISQEEKDIEYKLFLENIILKYKGYLNFLENVFYFEGTTFHKHQQIDNMQNIILSLRYLTKINYITKKQIINYIKNELSYLTKDIDIHEEVLLKYESMYYTNSLEKILLSLSILFDYEQLKETFKYLIYIFLPYMLFGYYLRFIIVNNYSSFDKIDINDFKNYIKNNNKQMIEYFHLFLQKFYFIKIITDFKNRNEELEKSINELTTQELLSLLNIDNLLKNENSEINILDIFELLHKLFNSNDVLFQYNFDYNKVFEQLTLNINSDINNNNITKELIINFTPIKLEFIHLDNNIFDWIEKTLEKKCIFCSKTTKYDYICLICGNKICHTRDCNRYNEHIKKCSGDTSIFIDMDNMKVSIFTSYNKRANLFPLYVNENGVGPNGYEMGNEFKLSQEKLKLALKIFSCNDFHLN